MSNKRLKAQQNTQLSVDRDQPMAYKIRKKALLQAFKRLLTDSRNETFISSKIAKNKNK